MSGDFSNFLSSFLPYDLIGLVAMGLVWFLTGKVRSALLAAEILDRPNERSMHAAPVPRGGGLAVMSAIALGLLLFVLLDLYLPFLFLLTALLFLMLVSWIDDKRGLPARVRLPAHLIAALIGSFALGENVRLFGDIFPLWLDRTIMVFGWAWLINLTNFMDGIDGITGVEAACVTLGAGLLFWILNFFVLGSSAFSPDMLLAALIGGACLGFLFHNWHPAKIFLGDVGSVPLGFLMGYILLRLALFGYPAAALILPLYYLADSGLTLARRAVKGEKIWLPHRQHFYQRAAAGEGRHDRVVLWVWGANLGLIALAALALFHPLPALASGVILVALLLLKLHKSGLKKGLS